MVEKALVKPLAEKEARRSRFTRAYIPPQARRVRVLDREPSTDGRGAAFVAFAVDERSGVLEPRAADDAGRWRKDAIIGCVYPARDEIFIRRGDKFYGVGLLLGQKTAAAADTTCRPAPTGIHANPPALMRTRTALRSASPAANRATGRARGLESGTCSGRRPNSVSLAARRRWSRSGRLRPWWPGRHAGLALFERERKVLEGAT